MLTLVGISLFALAEYLFDIYAMKGQTNWYIFYFSCTYISMTLVSVDLLFREGSDSMRVAAVMFGLFFFSLVINEVRFINVPYDDYILAVNSNKARLMGYGLLVIVLTYLSITAWAKRLSRK